VRSSGLSVLSNGGNMSGTPPIDSTQLQNSDTFAFSPCSASVHCSSVTCVAYSVVQCINFNK
jgi:hypothetical protein